MITETMTIRELVRAIRAGRACEHLHSHAFFAAEIDAVRVMCDDCGRKADIDLHVLGITRSQAIRCWWASQAIDLAQMAIR